MVENAKKNMHSATKISPKCPNTEEKATCANFEPVSPDDSAPVVKNVSAVNVSTTNVSKKTPIKATTP